ncbi:hypothetical protein [Lactococcus allomyrinae]|uniref:Uncharacterized protein n=1 Tax=Lactococcus allomyrinae TaxID=2419773 RepID=A0A387BCC2_9LACT|nr:hypothetical protein [Lactococcus allomyrinae]AYG01453.1 hypothetical protein D7I46_10470 [Lactococcus allomyrinae]
MNKQWSMTAKVNELERRKLKKFGAVKKEYREFSIYYKKIATSGSFCPPVRVLLLNISNKPHQSHRPNGRARK